MTAAGLFYTPYGYNEMDLSRRFLPPGPPHLMGTDSFGRDVFSRVMIGGRYTLAVAAAAVLSSAAIGITLGMICGYTGGLLDEGVLRLMDGLSSFPGILLALSLFSLMGNSPFTLCTALCALFVPSYVRITRNGMLRYKRADFTSAARAMGASGLRVMFIHILPNLGPTLFSAVALGFSNAILAESAMSYLGFGVQPPFPSWGRMLAESQNVLFNAPWCALAPGTVIALTVIAFHSLDSASPRFTGAQAQRR
jgi:peptide/nickel transport system permease protein